MHSTLNIKPNRGDPILITSDDGIDDLENPIRAGEQEIN